MGEADADRRSGEEGRSDREPARRPVVDALRLARYRASSLENIHILTN